MKLTELEPQFKKTIDARTMCDVDTLAEAQGIMFFCPACFQKNGGSVGTHVVLVWFEGRDVPPEWGLSVRWAVSGSGYVDLNIHPSIDSKCWHGFVKNGEIS